MLKENSKVKVHICDHRNFPSFECESKPHNYNQVFEVKKQNGKIGIDWNTKHLQSICNGELFTPFRSFAWNVIFEDVETGKLYNYSDVAGGIAEVEKTIDKRFEKLKRELFYRGTDCIEEFLGFDIDCDWDKNTIIKAMDEVYKQMPNEELELFYKKFCII